MNPVAMWLRSHPAERTALLAAALLAVVALMAVAGGRLLAGSSPAPPQAPAQNTSANPASQASPLPQSVPSVATGPTGSPAAPPLPREGTQPDPQSLAQARSVATGFLVAYTSYSYSDAPDALRQRLRPFDSDRLDAVIGQSSGASYLRQQQTARHEVATAQVTSLDSEGYGSNGELGFIASVQQDVKSSQGPASQKRYFEVFLSQTDAGWRVEEISE